MLQSIQMRIKIKAAIEKSTGFRKSKTVLVEGILINVCSENGATYEKVYFLDNDNKIRSCDLDEVISSEIQKEVI